MDIFEILQIFATVTGIIYLILQILHSRYMWYVYVPSCAALAACMFHQHTWAFFALNVYFVIMGCIGAYNWKKDESGNDSGKIVINRLQRSEVLLALGILAVCIPLLAFVMTKTGDPHPWLDAVSTSLAIIGTWWLAKSHIEQWLVWLAADCFIITMQILLGNYYLVLMYAFYIISSIIGLWNWKRKGTYA